MVTYDKPWLSVDEQIRLLEARGLRLSSEAADPVLRSVGYYRLSGYLFPFRRSEPTLVVEKNKRGEDVSRERRMVFDDYLPGTTFDEAVALVDFDRELRMLVMDGIERLEVAVRAATGYTLGRVSPFAHEEASCFTENFRTRMPARTTNGSPDSEASSRGSVVHDRPAGPADREDGLEPSAQESWLDRLYAQQAKSEEAYVVHFRDKYDNQTPIWVLTELLELGQLTRLYRGLNDDLATRIAREFGAPTKKVMVSWLASLNYVRNVSAHHARLFNRKLQHAPARPKNVAFLAHLGGESAKQKFGTYNALAVLAFLLRSVHGSSDWAPRLAELLDRFPAAGPVTIASLGAPSGWRSQEIWQ